MKSLRTSSTPEFRPAGRVLAGLLLRTPVPSVPTPLPQGEVGERIAADPAFGLTREQILRHLDPADYIGCCPEQVERFLDWLDAFSERNRIKFTITMTADPETVSPEIKKYAM